MSLNKLNLSLNNWKLTLINSKLTLINCVVRCSPVYRTWLIYDIIDVLYVFLYGRLLFVSLCSKGVIAMINSKYMSRKYECKSLKGQNLYMKGIYD